MKVFHSIFSIPIRLLSLFAVKQIRFIQGASTIITNYLSFSMFSIDISWLFKYTSLEIRYFWTLKHILMRNQPRFWSETFHMLKAKETI